MTVTVERVVYIASVNFVVERIVESSRECVIKCVQNLFTDS